MYGPKITTTRRCTECPACIGEPYRVQSDSGVDYYCQHPRFRHDEQKRKYIGFSSSTPDWCPAESDLTPAEAAVAYSHNFATSKPDIGGTEREHILGLCTKLSEAAADIERLRAENVRLRKIAAHIPAADWIAAKERAGCGALVRATGMTPNA